MRQPEHEPKATSMALRVADEYRRMPPDTMVDVYLNGSWHRMTAASIVDHHVKLHEATHGT